MTDKGLNLFDDCAAECVYLCPQEEQCNSFSWGHSKFTDRQARTQINKNGAAVNVIILVELRIL